MLGKCYPKVFGVLAICQFVIGNRNEDESSLFWLVTHSP